VVVSIVDDKDKAKCDGCGIRVGTYVNGELTLRAEEGVAFLPQKDGVKAICRKGHTSWHPLTKGREL